MQITITQKDIEDYKIQNTESCFILDELAYAAKQYTSNEVDENARDYGPSEPYNFDFEKDLLANTRTPDELYKIAKTLEVSLNANWERISKEQGLQAGACVALNNPESWQELLEAYTESLKEAPIDESMSGAYNDAYTQEIEDYQNNCYEEWLKGDRNYAGVIYEISQYFTGTRAGSWDEKTQEYTFVLSPEDIENYKEADYDITKEQDIKAGLLEKIKESSNAYSAKQEVERAERREQYQKEKTYKENRAREAEEARKAKLQAMTL